MFSWALLSDRLGWVILAGLYCTNVHYLSGLPKNRFPVNADSCMPRPLTQKQQTIYDFIRGLILARGYGPTMREIQAEMNFRSPNGVRCHLRALEAKGMIIRAAGKSRAIELTEPIARIVSADLPVLGVLEGGGLVPSHGVGQEPVHLTSFVQPGSSVLRVGDESMLEANIAKGDLLVVAPKDAVRNGELAVVRTGESTLVRYWYSEAGRIRLSAVDSRATPIFVESVDLLGVVTGVVRSMS